MSWFAPVRTASGGMTRHKVQVVVITVVLLVSTASATLGLTLLVAVNAPFQHAFAAQRGADVTLSIDAGRVNSGQLGATGGLAGVSAVAGPFPEATAELSYGADSLGPRVLAGRTSPGGSVDHVALNEGHWPDAPGQVVLDAGPGGGAGYPGLGDRVNVTGVPGVHALTVVGFATSITKTADGWVTPPEVARLRAPAVPATVQMLYRFTAARSEAQVRADVNKITRSLPFGAVIGAASWLAAERTAAGSAAIMEPFVVAFALIGLAMAVLIVANLVAGAVVAQFHRIGVLKSIGLTPTQVVAAYLGRIGLPALAGAILGGFVGNLAAIPVLSKSSGIYGIGRPQVPWWASVVALAGMLALTGLAALGPAARAGHLSATEAIAAGRAPRIGRGYLAHRLTSRMGLPRPAGIGVAAPFARPARTVVTLAAIAFGATAVTFAVGLSSGLNRAEQAQTLSAPAPVQVQLANPHDRPTAAQDAAVNAALMGQSATKRYVATYGGRPGEAVRVPGISATVTAQAYDGDASWLGYALVTGHWYDAREVVVNTTFLTQSGLSVGDTATIDSASSGTAPETVRIAGEVFQPSDNPWLITSTATLPALRTQENLQSYEVALRPGTNAAAYMHAVNTALGPDSPWQAVPPQGNQFYGLASGLIGLLALMVAIAAGLGVLNTVLMSTRDRVRDLGIFKAIGMRPVQMLVMVVCSIIAPAVIAAVIAAPAATALTTATLHAMASTAHSGVPASFTQVLPASRLALLSIGALLIALIGALLPASWAARARPAMALRAE